MMLVASLFAIFGALCGLWLTVVGIAVTTVGLIAICGLASYLLGGPLTPMLLLWCAIALQAGYFVTLACKTIVLHVRRMRGAGKTIREDQTPAEIRRNQN
ncbi:hypothetical protein U8607_08395 [Methylobacterium durans]|uniref:hypothetical protein n=1 Tax=Methylobacterium durans TaxID=2202825 RepID=UPI002AFE6E4E|nr:hypothetical protein [Methylobacterium durans]MEA1832101.1 hypothetical protein [Methylobacterium durans]